MGHGPGAWTGNQGPSQAQDQAGPGTKPVREHAGPRNKPGQGPSGVIPQGPGPSPKHENLDFLKENANFYRAATHLQPPGKDNSALAEDLHSKIPSLVALGN